MSLDRLLAQLEPRQRGPQFELLCRWYLNNAPEYRGRFKRVWLWRDWPDAWGPDAGIDLVAEQHDGGLWAIQSKAYDPVYAIKKADVDSFLSESSRPEFTYRLLIATTDRLGPTAKRTLDDQREPVGYILRSQLELAPVAWPQSLDDLRSRRPPRKKPFPHVKEAIKATVRGFKGTDRGQLLMACGTGKTLAAMWISERLDSRRTLVLLPSLSLLGQTLREWTANAHKPFEFLAVCSDETVVGEDKLIQHTAELGLPVTTDAELIAGFLCRRGRRVVFATYQSSPQIAAALEHRTPRFDLAIADEAHRCAGRVGTEFTTILDPARIKSKRRLFMTATPRFYTPRLRHEAGQLDVEVASMEDDPEGFFGSVLHRLTFGEAIERDLLSDYQVVVVGVTDSMYRHWAEHGDFVTIDGEHITDARRLAGQVGLAKTMRKYDLKRIVSFHSRVPAARRFARELPDVIAWLPRGSGPSGTLWADFVSGAMSSGVRDARLRHLRAIRGGDRGLLSNARCLGEGVDVPTLDGVAFIDPRRSTIDIIQALGRAIRKAPDKKVGTIVIPVFVDEDADPEEAIDSSAFKHVWDVLRALRAHDDQLAEELDELRRRQGAFGAPPERPSKIKLDLPRAIVGAGFADAFNARLVEFTTQPWDYWLGLLQAYIAREGHALVPASHVEDGHRLGQWVNVQRTWRAQAKLSRERTARLEGIPEWVWEPHEHSWQRGFEHLTRFVEREGHARVPGTHHEDGYALGKWVVVQRVRRRQGSLPGHQRDALESLPEWAWKKDLDALWNRRLEALRTFALREGHTFVPSRYSVDGFNLGAWVNTQRSRYRKGELSASRRRSLEAIQHWTWNAADEHWEQGFAVLEHFVAREGHARVPQQHRESGFGLGGWVQRQRQEHKSGTLRSDRAKRLAELPEWTWRASDTAWNRGFSALQRFASREGHAGPPHRHVEDGYPLGSWVNTQRSLHRAGRLGDDRRGRLESLTGWRWNPDESRWENAFEHLERFVARRGDAKIPKDHKEEGFALGAWASQQRQKENRGELPAHRKQRLESLPGWQWMDTRWEKHFEALESFVAREGNARVPAKHQENGLKLGGWLRRQRQAIARGQLDGARRHQLEQLPGWALSPNREAWDRALDRLEAFRKREGHVLVPSVHEEEGFQLGAWVAAQRSAHRRGALSDERRRRLDAIPGWTWNPPKQPSRPVARA